MNDESLNSVGAPQIFPAGAPPPGPQAVTRGVGNVAIPVGKSIGLGRGFRRWFGRRLMMSLLIAAAASAVCYLERDFFLGVRVTVYPVKRIDLTQTVVASGRVITPARVSVGTQVTGRVASVPVVEGQRVIKDQPLIVLDDEDQRAALEQAQALVLQNEARLTGLADVDRPAAQQTLLESRSNLELADSRLQRFQDLRAKGFIGQSDLDAALNAKDVATSHLRSAELQFSAKRPGGSDEQQVVSSLSHARAGLKAAMAGLDHTVIRAPSAGTLIGRDVEAGDVVQAGKDLMVLAVDGETQITVQIDEKDLSLLRVGQQALASADAFPDRRFPAELFYVNPGVDSVRGSVEVKLKVPNPPEYLRQEMTASVDIVVAQRPSAIAVPADVIRDDMSGGAWVLVVDGHRAERRPIHAGLRGAGFVEVIEGLSLDDQVIASASEHSPESGQRIRVSARR